MKFLRRESERGDYTPSEAKRLPPSQAASSRRLTTGDSVTGSLTGSHSGSPEPTPVPRSASPSVVSTSGHMISDTSSITTQTPDNVIGETLVVQGRVEFKNLLRIDGHFEGELIGNGSLIIGPTAEVISNLRGLNEVYVEGILIGDCSCQKMQIRFAGCVTGNLQCASLGMDPSVVLKGSANINPREKVEKHRSKTSAPRHKSSRSQGRSTEDGSSRGPHSAGSPDAPEMQKQRRKGSGSVERSEAVRPEGGPHRRQLSGDSTASSANLVGDDMSLPIPPMLKEKSGDGEIPSVVDGKAPVRAPPPVRPANAPRKS